MPHCGTWEFWCVPLSPGGRSIPVRLCSSVRWCASVVCSFGAGVHPLCAPRYVSRSFCSVPLSCSADTACLQQLWHWDTRPGGMHQRSRALDFWKKAQHVSLQSPLQLSRNCRVRLWDYVCTVTPRVAKAYWTLWLMLAFPMTISPAALLT